MQTAEPLATRCGAGRNPGSDVLHLAIMHPLVDACSIGVLVAGGMSWERVLAYNAIAFALQLPMGVMMDRFPYLMHDGFLFGTGMTLIAAILSVLYPGGWVMLALACFGNALFHLSAGKHILETREGRAGPIGLFIATGALGLMAGQVWASKLCLGVSAVALAACLALAAMHIVASSSRGALVAKASPVCIARLPLLVVFGLLALIAWRSWAGLSAGGRLARECALMMLAGAAVTFAGKVVGGYLAERIGRWRVTIISVSGSVALAFFCEPAWIAAWLSLLFVAQLATGPVLSIVYDKVGRRGGTAFGLNCFGLFTGSLA